MKPAFALLLTGIELPQDGSHDEIANEQINPEDYDYQSKRGQLVVEKAREEPQVEGCKHNERYNTYLPTLRRVGHNGILLRTTAPHRIFPAPLGIGPDKR